MEIIFRSFLMVCAMFIFPYCKEVKAENCLVTIQGKEYTGRQNKTRENISCQRWDEQLPHRHTQTQVRFNTLTDKSMDHNYCRNPDNEPNGPWCYTTDRNIRWRYCDIPKCEESKNCTRTVLGKEYTGTRNRSMNNLTCQRWDVQVPRRHTQTQARFNTLMDKSMNHNYCRNPDNEPNGPWCYTIRTNTRWQYCDIPKCNDGKTCTKTELGKDYTGTRNLTRDNFPCQKWNVQIPHRHTQTQVKFNTLTDSSMDHNYCRNPNNEPNGPWCYTTNINYRWQYCDIPKCYSKTCTKTVLGKEYTGTQNWTSENITCQRWDVQFPHKHTRGEEQFSILMDPSRDHNYCRNPDNEPNGPWCYTTNRNIRWQYCGVPKCGERKTCRKTVLGSEYTGTRNWTRENITCQRWIAQYPHKHTQTQGRFNNLMDPTTNHNYCRNPDNEPGGPWCYTTNRYIRWQYCDIPKCDEEKPNITIIPIKDTDIELESHGNLDVDNFKPYTTRSINTTTTPSLHTKATTGFIKVLTAKVVATQPTNIPEPSLHSKGTTGFVKVPTVKVVATQRTHIPEPSFHSKEMTGFIKVSTAKVVATQPARYKPSSTVSADGMISVSLVVGICIALVIAVICVTSVILWCMCYKTKETDDSLQMSLVYNNKS